DVRATNDLNSGHARAGFDHEPSRQHRERSSIGANLEACPVRPGIGTTAPTWLSIQLPLTSLHCWVSDKPLIRKSRHPRTGTTVPYPYRGLFRTLKSRLGIIFRPVEGIFYFRQHFLQLFES